MLMFSFCLRSVVGTVPGILCNGLMCAAYRLSSKGIRVLICQQCSVQAQPAHCPLGSGQGRMLGPLAPVQVFPSLSAEAGGVAGHRTVRAFCAQPFICEVIRSES